MIRSLLLIAALLPGCADETISGYADRSAMYQLREVDGAPFAPAATISFPEPGRVSGTAPCNAYSAEQTAPYPWFALGPIAATKRACLHMEGEDAFFSALREMTLAEVQGPVLILTSEAGREMVFRQD